MRSFSAPLFLAAALALLAAAPGALAHPGHGDVLPLAARQGTLNGTSVGTAGNSSTADDHVPDFKTDCVCPEPICDSRLNAASICQCKSQAQLACYKKSNGGCPKPDDNACPTSAT